MEYKRWTESDNAFLRDNYGLGKMNRAQLAEVFHRSEASIKNQIKKLGLSADKKHPWTEGDIEILKVLFSRSNWEELIEAFKDKHTEEGIRMKAKKLGLKRIR